MPRGLERELVHERDREYDLRGSESRTLSTVGAFRVVSSRTVDISGDLDRSRAARNADGRPGHSRREIVYGGVDMFDVERQVPYRRVKGEQR